MKGTESEGTVGTEETAESDPIGMGTGAAGCLLLAASSSAWQDHFSSLLTLPFFSSSSSSIFLRFPFYDYINVPVRQYSLLRLLPSQWVILLRA